MRNNAKIRLIAAAVLPFLLLAVQVFGQSANSSLSGTIVDASQAVLPGATVTATNQDTGVTATTVTNEAGNYTFPSLQPGLYRVTAEMPSFQTQTKTDVKLGVGGQARLNFELAIAGSETQIEDTTTAQDMLIEASSSTGTVLAQDTVAQLPLVSNDVMDLLNTMGGVVKAEDPIFSAYTQTFAGVSSGNINITRDGVTVNEVRYTSGIVSPSRINQELVGEFKMILSPVDAEMGRGAGQVQILTKSGSNAFHGSGVWNIQNTALDAREFEAKRSNESAPWRNMHNYTLSVSGPIVKNKTFFFVSWDQQLVRSKAWMTATTLTPCARKGIYRYFPGVVGINADDSSSYNSSAYPTAKTVVSNIDGKPRMVVPDPTQTNPAWAPHLAAAGLTPGQVLGPDDIAFQSVFGPLDATAIDQILDDPINCSQYPGPSASNPRAGLVDEVSYDQYRMGWDQSGYVDKFLALLPEANYFGSGDALNIAAHRWYRTTQGSNNIFGTGEDNRRKQITVKLDHNLSAAHRISGTYTWEKNIGEDGGPVWPENSYIGANWRKPQSLTSSLTSTITPTLLNEFRFGLSRLTGYVMSSRDTDERLDPILNDLTSGINKPAYTIDAPIVVSYDSLGFGPGSNYASGISHPYASRGILNSTWGGTDHRWTFADTITWLKGSHSFKAGGELRLSKSWYTTDGEGGFYSTSSTYPMITGGDNFNNGTSAGAMYFWGGIPSWQGMYGSRFSGSQWGNVYNLMNFLAGSVADVRQYHYVVRDPDGTLRWNDILAGENQYINDIRSREFSLFFKDDWKVSSDLTLNLGVRYEYYGVPWNETGMSASLKGGNSNLIGEFGETWMSWLGMTSDGSLSEYTFVGPNSSDTSRGVWNKDLNNFGPHVGFSWQLPWFGKGKTTLRGGYSISYSPLGNADYFKGLIGSVSGTSVRHTRANATTDPYVNLATVGDYLGQDVAAPDGKFRPVIRPMETITDRSKSISVLDENIRNPYVQSLNVSLTRQIGNALTVDVRYIGTLARNQLSTINLNTPRYMDNGLFEELEYARRAYGGPIDLTRIPLLSQIFPGENPIEQMFNVIGGSASTLLNGDFSSLASSISTAGTSSTGARGTYLDSSGLPKNLIYTNPQFSSANLTRNDGYTNYHSMQAQVTMRPVRGLSFQATYTWSRNLGDQGVGDYLTGERRYYLAGMHRSHTLATHGSYELPFGANGFLFRDASGVFKKAIEGWNLSWIANITSGIPGSIGAANSYWSISNPVLVDPTNWDNKAGVVTWEPGAPNGLFFGEKYEKVLDPQCTDGTISSPLIGRVGTCGLRALALASDPDHIVIRNARPGEIGNYAPNSLTGPGRWSLDMAMSKSVEFMEGKRLELRVDAQNIFNHPTPSNSAFSWNARFTQISNPDFSLNSTGTFGYLSTKGHHRTFQAKIRISF